MKSVPLIVIAPLLAAALAAAPAPPGKPPEKTPKKAVPAGESLSLASCCASGELFPPVRLQAGGAFIDTGKCIGHSGPALLDVDGDGRRELLVGDFSGHIHVFENSAPEGAPPAFAAGTMLEAGGKPVKISNW